MWILTLSLGFGAGPNCNLDSIGALPLMDMTASDLWEGQDGGLYGGGENVPPAAHLQAVMDAAAALHDSTTPIVMISVGMSNTTQEFSAFVPLASTYADAHPELVVIDGAQGGQDATAWDDPSDATWDAVDRRLGSYTPDDVRVAWVKQAVAGPNGTFDAHTGELQALYSDIAKALLVRYPNIELAYFSSRTKAWTDQGLNPEPYAYESAYAVRAMVLDQIAGAPELEPGIGAPLLLWGPYLWADGTTPRSDGFTWECSDTVDDCTHPSDTGQQKIADLLLDFFTTDPTAVPWFTASWEPGSTPTDPTNPTNPTNPTDTYTFYGSDPTTGAPADAKGEGGGGCGCASPSPGSGVGLAWLALAAGVLRRRSGPAGSR